MDNHTRVFNSLFIVTDWNRSLLNLCLTPFAYSCSLRSLKKPLVISDHVRTLVTHDIGRNMREMNQ